jgi:endonuclease/exonuclease/phosphatase family metal-dependent hydrolase
MTFNLLCPAYKRCHTGGAAGVVDSVPEGQSPLEIDSPLARASNGLCGLGGGGNGNGALGGVRRYRESTVESEWRARLSLTLQALREAQADIVVLQEWWFTSPLFQELFLAAVQEEYSVEGARRTGGKDDGILVLLRKRWIAPASDFASSSNDNEEEGAFEMRLSSLARREVKLAGLGNRIMLALQIRLHITPLAAVNAAQPAAASAPSPDAAAAAAPVSSPRRAASPRLAVEVFRADSSSSQQQPHHSFAWKQSMLAERAMAAAATAAVAGVSSSVAPAPASASSSPAPAHAAGAAAADGSRTFSFHLLSTHLTFPHGPYDALQRKAEIASLLCAMDQVRYPKPQNTTVAAPLDPSVPPLCSWPVVLCGDFNTQLHCTEDSVYRAVVARSFRSAYASTHDGREPAVTHRTHRKECTPVDFIYVKNGSPTPEEKKQMAANMRGEAAAAASHAAGVAARASEDATIAAAACASSTPPHSHPLPRAYPSLRPIYSTLLPTTLPDSTWPSAEEYNISDHRPLLALFEIHA